MQWADPTGIEALHDVAVQPDGKVLGVNSIRTTYHSATWNYGMQIVRLNADGSWDTTFGTNGSATVAVDGTAFGTAVAVQPDGKILVRGRASISHDSNGQEYIVARLNPDGTLDATFGNSGRKRAAGGGLWQYNPTAGGERVYDLAVLIDSTGHETGIMVEGQGLGGPTAAFAAIKLTPAGQTDTTYGSGGSAVFNLGVGVSPTPEGMAITPAGGVVMVGEVTGPAGVIEALTPTGQLDTTFNGTGYRVDNFPGTGGTTYFEAVTVQPLAGGGYDIVVAGRVAGADSGLVARYTSGGQLDPTFATGGLFITTVVSEFTSVKVEADGSVALAGRAQYTDAGGNIYYQIAVGHLFVDGTPDITFGTAGNGFSFGWPRPG
jgi:uncharacterized delta-60 repeat protein